jgi:hypothetical protein
MVGHDVGLRLAITRGDDSGRTVEAATQPLARHRRDEEKQVDDEAERGAHAGESRQTTAARRGGTEHAPRVAIRARVDNRTTARGPVEGLAEPPRSRVIPWTRAPFAGWAGRTPPGAPEKAHQIRGLELSRWNSTSWRLPCWHREAQCQTSWRTRPDGRYDFASTATRP